MDVSVTTQQLMHVRGHMVVTDGFGLYLGCMVIVMMVLGQEICSSHTVWQVFLIVLCIHTGPDATQVSIACS